MTAKQTVLYSLRDAQKRLESLTEEIVLQGHVRDDLLTTARTMPSISEEDIRKALNKTND